MVIETETVLRHAFEEILKVVIAEATQTLTFKTLLKRLQNTLECIEPVFYENQRLIKVLDRPQKETILFISYLKIGKKLVLKSSRLSFRNRYQKLLHSYKLVWLNNELVRFFQTDPVHVTVGFNSNLEEFILDARSTNYSTPESIKEMGQLKVLTITGHCDHPSKILNLSILTCLSSLTTIRFEHMSVPSIQPIFALRNLKQLSFVICEIGDAFMSFTTESHYNMLPNLTRLEIDMCYDLKELPSWLPNLVNLQMLSITNCHELGVIPKGLGGLSNLESLSLHSCTKLEELRESVGGLRSLRSVDISDCLSISVLPEEIGELCGLRVLKMDGCTGLQELPVSTSDLSRLEEVICDEEMLYLWMDFESDLPNVKINVVEDDKLETFMKIVQ